MILREIGIMNFLWLCFLTKNGYHSSISMDLFEALYGMRCRSLIGWFEVGESSLLGPELIYKTLDTVHIIRKSLVNSV